VTVVFSMLTSAYLVRRGLPGWGALPKPPLLWANTLLLVLSSLALERAKRLTLGEGLSKARPWLLGAALLAALFVGGQLVVWKRLAALGYTLAHGPASGFFYLLTAIHGLHLVGGLIAWGRVWRHPSPLRVELCALYWHFLLAVWLWIFALLHVT